MKTSIVLLFLMSVISIGRTQSYFPFQTDTAHWNVLSHDGSRDKSQTVIFNYFINGDTIIDSVQYSKIYNGHQKFDTVIDTINAIYYGGLREDTNKHIFFKPNRLFDNFSLSCWIDNYTLDEFLLYRFNLVENDTFRLSQFDPGSNISVFNLMGERLNQ